MITYQNAMDKALDYLKGYDIPIVITLHGRFSEGWFYCYQSREYLETGEFSAQAETVSRFMSYLDEIYSSRHCYHSTFIHSRMRSRSASATAASIGIVPIGTLSGNTLFF